MTVYVTAVAEALPQPLLTDAVAVYTPAVAKVREKVALPPDGVALDVTPSLHVSCTVVPASLAPANATVATTALPIFTGSDGTVSVTPLGAVHTASMIVTRLS